jgi:hypothetical protein
VTDLAGHLDAGQWSELTMLRCGHNHITSIEMDNNNKLRELKCVKNKLSGLDVSHCAGLTDLGCSLNQLTSLVLNTELEFLECYGNRLSLNYLFASSEIMGEEGQRWFGTQNLPPQNVGVGVPLFTDQSVFNSIFTIYSVMTQNGVPVPESRYTVANGTIMFHESGVYKVAMTNDAIITSFSFDPAEVVVMLQVGDVGTVENKKAEIDVFPNPTTGELKIKSNGLKIEGMEVFDMYGRNLDLCSPSVSPDMIDVSYLPAGLYLLKINTETGVVIQKISKI